jgi:uncharacterized membrane protein YccC
MRIISKLFLLTALVACLLGLADGWMLWPQPPQDSPAQKLAKIDQALTDHMVYQAEQSAALDKRVDSIESRVRTVEDAISRIEARSASTHEAAVGIFVALLALIGERISERMAKRVKEPDSA